MGEPLVDCEPEGLAFVVGEFVEALGDIFKDGGTDGLSDGSDGLGRAGLFGCGAGFFVSCDGAALGVDESSVRERGDEGCFGPFGGVEAFGAEPDFHEYILHGVIDLRIDHIEVSAREAVDEAAELVDDLAYGGFISVRDSLESRSQSGSFRGARGVRALVSRISGKRVVCTKTFLGLGPKGG
jgi:hypothetical protein